ncbi:MAG: hypothetical protein CME70_11285 [Halobacteriovorax sp.]|nr:hypothetical protein [Halobacteriovorax sp.]
MTCHYNPYGNGPLTDYGRALSATTISDRLIHSKSKSEEELAEKSNFLYMKAFNSRVRPSVDYRGLRLIRDLKKDNPKYETIHMQADFNTVIRFDGTDKYIASISFGYAPTPKSQKGKDVGNYRSREHYIGIRPNNKIGFYLGMMDKVFGIRVPDHIAFSRSITGLAQNDQAHGALIHFMNEDFELGLHSFLGNLDQESDLRQAGGSTKLEYTFSTKLKPGISLLWSRSDHTELFMKSLHVKMGFSKGSSLLFEVGSKTQLIESTKKSTDSGYGLIQNHILLRRGLFSLVTFEYFRPDFEKDANTLRLGPGIQYFPFQGVEVRFDLYNTKNYSSSSATKDNWDMGGQLHLWF